MPCTPTTWWCLTTVDNADVYADLDASNTYSACRAVSQVAHRCALVRNSPFLPSVLAARKEELRRRKWKIAHGVPGQTSLPDASPHMSPGSPGSSIKRGTYFGMYRADEVAPG